jgi:hypothetical protein
MGFTVTSADDYPNVSEPSPVADHPFGPNLSFGDVANEALDSLHVVGPARATPTTSSSRRLASAPNDEATIITVDSGVGMGQEFWRFLTRSLDGVIKLNSTSQVIPSAEAIVAEVLRQQKIQRTEQHGTGVIRENWLHHTVETDIARDAGLAYHEIDGGRDRNIFWPV